jgi:polyhydroxyalkanoate synthesis repressor PhaR
MNDTTTSKPTVTIKKYANRRLYNTATSSYVTLEDLSAMVKDGVEFCVYDAKTSEDITRSVLTQIIVEEEGKSGQQNLLPIGFLRNLIGYYGDNMQWMVPKYLEHSMDLFSKNQDQIKTYFQSAFGNMFPFGTTLEEVGKQNLAMFERAMRLFNPSDDATAGTSASTDTSSSSSSACVSPTGEAEASCACKATNLHDSAPTSCCTTASTPSTADDSALSQESCCCCCSADNDKKSADSTSSTPDITLMSNVKTATAAAGGSDADDMQQKIANLQRQLADLAKSRA